MAEPCLIEGTWLQMPALRFDIGRKPLSTHICGSSAASIESRRLEASGKGCGEEVGHQHGPLADLTGTMDALKLERKEVWLGSN